MIDPEEFLSGVQSAGIRFVTGVPDSLLKHVCACMTAHLPKSSHVIAVNEGGAIAMAIGHYLVTGRPALVYLQNSGLGNVINPITSLADPAVYGIPMVLLIGWRGELCEDGRQLRDEPQHVLQGRLTPAQLDLLGVRYQIIDATTTDIGEIIDDLTRLAMAKPGPVAMLARRDSFAAYPAVASSHPRQLMTREESIRTILDALPHDMPVVATTGMASRELFEYRKNTGRGHHRDFLTVGGMGHASQIAAGIAMAVEQHRLKIACLDGDGALLMHMGSLAICAEQENLVHIVLNNGAHDSVGGQPTKGDSLALSGIANACGYSRFAQVSDREQLDRVVRAAIPHRGSVFIEVRCKPGARRDLARPDRTPAANKADFMRFLESMSGE